MKPYTMDTGNFRIFSRFFFFFFFGKNKLRRLQQQDQDQDQNLNGAMGSDQLGQGAFQHHSAGRSQVRLVLGLE
jgi:hypothetical protein